MKKSLFCIILFLLLLNSASAFNFNKYYDSSRYFIRINNNLLLNPAFTGFNNHFNLSAGFGSYTPDIPVSNDWSKPKEYIFAPEFSFGKLLSYSFGLTKWIKNEGAFTSKQINLAFSVSLQTIKYGNFRIGFSGGSLSYTNDFSKLLFGDMINPKMGFIYSTQEILPSTGKYELKLDRYNAGIFYSYKNLFYIGYSILDFNEPMMSFYQDNHSILHSKSIITAGGRVKINKDFDVSASALVEHTSFYELTKIMPAVGVGYKCKYYFGGGIKLINSEFTSYYFQLYDDLFKCVTIAFKYELLKHNYFSNSLSPSYWGVSATFYIDNLIKFNK